MIARRAVLLDTGASGPRARESAALQASLVARGFTFERFGDPRAVIEHLGTTPADVLIVDADSPWLDLREFVEAIRRDPRTARTLLAALATGDPRELPARREIALILAKPINPDEAASRLEGLVVTRQRAVTNTRELRGDLTQLPLPDLLQLLSASRASGVLAIEAVGRRSTIHLEQGDLREVSAGPAVGIKALARALQFAEGTFVFAPATVAASEKAGEIMALGPALFEATRQTDEVQRLHATLPESWVEIRRTRKSITPAMRTQIDQTPALREVEKQLETSRTIASLLDASALSDADLLQGLDAFRREGLLEFAGTSSGDRIEVVNVALAAALVTRLEGTGRTTARVLVLIDSAATGAEATVLRALGGVAGFVSTESGSAVTVPLGVLGMLVSGDARIELFAVPLERELHPLWAVFGAGAEAAIVTGGDASRDERAIAAEIGVPIAVVDGAPTASSIAEALRSALEQIAPRR